MDDKKKKQGAKHTADVAASQAEISEAFRDIAPLPAVVHPQRRESCREDFLKFCLTYFPEIFTKPVSKNHPEICRVMQHAAMHGGKYAWCAERGGGKTTFCECFMVWAIAYGHCKFVLYCGATKDAAMKSFDSVKSEFENNDLLFEDFPEICHAARRLEGKANKAPGMLLDGETLGFTWRKDVAVFPTVPGSAASGTILKAVGFGAAIRGAKHKTKRGKNARPDCVIVDDIQKDVTAANPRNATRQIEVLKGAIAGLRERGKKMVILVPGTRLNPNCFMSQITDKKKHPSYGGKIFQAMPSLPENLDFWREYWKIRVDSANRRWEENPGDETAWRAGGLDATEFYKQNRDAMDAGCEVSWPDMFEKDEISGIQSIMNIYLENENTFWTEYQNAPRDGLSSGVQITEAILSGKVVENIPRGVVPAGTIRLTLGVDVGQEILYWMVVAWKAGFAGHIVAYGTFPQQPAAMFTGSDPPRGLSAAFPSADVQGRISAAVQAIIDGVLLHEWETESKIHMTIDRGLIDINWSESTEAIRTIINRNFREAFFKNGRYEKYPLLPSRGQGMTQYRKFGKKEYESSTQFSHLKIPLVPDELVGTVMFNADKTKSWAAERLTAPQGAPESITIHAAPDTGHTLLFQHLMAEYPDPKESGGLKYDKWTMKPAQTENHWWDCFGLNIVANAMEGARHATHDAPAKVKPLFQIIPGTVR